MQRIHRLPEVIKYVAEQSSMRISTSVLNQIIEDACAINPPPTDKGKQLRIYFATQVKIKPPTFVLFVNNPELMHFPISATWKTNCASPSASKARHSI